MHKRTMANLPPIASIYHVRFASPCGKIKAWPHRSNRTEDIMRPPNGLGHLSLDVFWLGLFLYIGLLPSSVISTLSPSNWDTELLFDIENQSCLTLDPTPSTAQKWAPTPATRLSSTPSTVHIHSPLTPTHHTKPTLVEPKNSSAPTRQPKHHCQANTTHNLSFKTGSDKASDKTHTTPSSPSPQLIISARRPLR